MSLPPIIRPPRISRSRRGWLITGLILFAYILSHLINHAAGLFGLAAMDAGQKVFVAIWHNPVATVLLYGSLLIHFLLALRSLYERRQLRMRPRDAIQLILGLAIPPLLAGHAIDTRLAYEWFDTVPSYARVLLLCWVSPISGVFQTTLLLVTWTHGCIGIYYWLRLKRWYPHVAPVFAALMLLVPVFALLGFLEGLRAVGSLAEQPGWAADTLAAAHFSTTEGAALSHIATLTRLGLAAILILVLVARWLRLRYERRHQSIRVTYPGDREIIARLGNTVLEISRAGAVPHAAVCGGRGRCSTCRVRILDGLAALPVAAAEEMAVLKRIGALGDVRLACQLRPTADLSVIPLLPAGLGLRDYRSAPDYLQGDEREICVLFADLRGFTRFSERKLPYDIVFFLNRYFETMGGAIEQAGGVTNQFTGDGVMALFGLEQGAAQGCRNAIDAAGAMLRGLAKMSADLVEDLDEPLRMGIGIHCGPTVVGRMGRGVAMYLTAVGDTVHVASRLQDLTKQYQCSLIISETAAQRAAIDVSGLPRHEIAVRNRSEPVAIRTVDGIPALDKTLTPVP